MLWTPHEYTGLWTPCDGIRKDGGRRDLGYLLDAWNSAESADWSLAKLQEWKFLKLTPKAFQAIQADSESIREAGRQNDMPEALQPKKELGLTDSEIDPSDFPPELDAANIAFMAVRNGHGDQSATARNRLVVYLQSHYPDFNSEQIQRIATVANPDKTTGRKKSGK